jgi:LPS-assembly protein
MRAMHYRRKNGSQRRLGLGAWLLCGALLAAAPARAEERAAEAPVARPGPAADSLARRYWVNRSALSAAARGAIPEYCSGAYVLPAFPHPLDSDPRSFPIVGDAEEISYRMDGRVELRGAVTLSQGNRTLTAGQGFLDQSTGEGAMSGQVHVLEPGLIFEGQSARIDMESRATSLEGVQFLLPAQSLRGEAREIRQDVAGNLIIRDGSFTRCEPGNNNWHIAVSSLEMNEEDVFGTARNAVVRIGKVPVLYAPYLRFPVRSERQSGLLFPDVGFSNDDGLDFRQPYYLNLAPNYDATVSPRFIERRGMGLETLFRHLANWQETTLNGAYLHKDNLFDGRLPRDDFDRLKDQGLVTGEFNPADRWRYGIDHRGELGNFQTLIDYRAVSDRDYFRDLGGDIGLSSRIELERRGEVAYAEGDLLVRLWAQRFDRLDEGAIDPYQRLPQVDARYRRELLGPLEWSLAGHWAGFDRDNDALIGLDRAVGQRMHLEPRLRLPLAWSWGFATLTGGYRYTRYDLRDLDDTFDSRPDRSVGHASLHVGMYVDRQVEAFGRPVTHSLEPQLFYLKQGYTRQDGLPLFDASELTFGYRQLFRDNRFSGVDRIGDADQLSLGVTSRLLDARTGREYLRGSVGQILYFADREVTLSGPPTGADRQRTSAVAGEIEGHLTEQWRLTSTVIWDPNQGQVDEGAVAVQYRRDERRIMNLGYRDRRRDDISQTDFSAYWPLSTSYGFIGRWNYDLDNSRMIEAFGGIEYNDCCWQIRLVGRRFLNIPTGANLVTGQELELVEPDDGVFFQIVFKGMGSFGDSLESLMARGIRGYKTESNNEF